MNNKEDIKELIKNVFDIYPFLTKKKRYDLAFMKYCLINTDIKNYLLNRNSKYLLESPPKGGIQSLIELYKENIEIYEYLLKEINENYLNNIDYFNE
jgi:hypothetical protein